MRSLNRIFLFVWWVTVLSGTVLRFFSPLAGATEATAWSTDRGDAQRSGRSTTLLGPGSPYIEFSAGFQKNLSNSPIIAFVPDPQPGDLDHKKEVVVVSGEDHLAILDPNVGEFSWISAIGNSFFSTPAMDEDGNIYLGSHFGKYDATPGGVHAFNSAGEPIGFFNPDPSADPSVCFDVCCGVTLSDFL